MSDLPVGLYDRLVTEGLLRRIEASGLQAQCKDLQPETSSEILARHLAHHLQAALSGFRGDSNERIEKQLQLTNAVLELVAGGDASLFADDVATRRRLVQVLAAANSRLGTGELPRPTIELRHSDLIVNGPRDLSVGHELPLEIASADRIDVLVSFIKYSGFAEIRDALFEFVSRVSRPGALRILTTTYMGATEHEALNQLRELGADIRVSYDTRRTRLHAKAWLFHRASGYSTALVGSSNLSHAALKDGCEWNVRLASVDNGRILRKFEATFEQYWADENFEEYEESRFLQATSAVRNPERDALARVIKLRPFPHQSVVLDALQVERDAGHHRNLVVAATGTGKTVIAALDYQRMCEKEGRRPALLFVAHRREILEKSLATFRIALSDGGFGELFVGGARPTVGTHVFASVQSLRAESLLSLPSDAYEVVIVDEFHHAEAPSYTALLEHLSPRILLGLTATPERADGQSILHWFDGRIAAESRLWDALDQDLLVPFQYFGVHDKTDLSHIDFRNGRYDVAALELIYTADEHRANEVLRALFYRVRDPSKMRALGFCVSVRHVEFMVKFFEKNGLRALGVTGSTPTHDRDRAIGLLERGEVCAIFTVDVFNEGVDIPRVDTLLMLRPTESATVFLQQLGRGLRLHESKSCLTVLDFIGYGHRRFRFDTRYRALLGVRSRSEVCGAIEKKFPYLPAGCSIQLDEGSQKAILQNIKESLSSWRNLSDELSEDWSLAEFLRRTGTDLETVYSAKHNFSELRAIRGFGPDVGASPIARAFWRALHVDDHHRLGLWNEWLSRDTPPTADTQNPAQLMFFSLLGWASNPLADLPLFFDKLWSNAALLREARDLFSVLRDSSRRVTSPLDGVPFHLHATYSRDEVSAGLLEVRQGKLLRTQGGVYKCDSHRCDVLFVTLEKDDKDFTPTTLYNDYVISRYQFHWESQASTRYESETARRYRNPPTDWRILLFVRQAKKDARGVTMPYRFLGPVSCNSATGERPVKIVWNLEYPMPADWYNEVKTAAG